MMKDQLPQNIYTILWYDDGGSCWCDHCVYTEDMAFHSAEEAGVAPIKTDS